MEVEQMMAFLLAEIRTNRQEMRTTREELRAGQAHPKAEMGAS
jgi:hypothetical protein